MNEPSRHGQSENSGDSRETHVIVVGKPAVPGRVKTRLAADIGEEPSTDLYRAFLTDLADEVLAFCDQRPGRRPILAHTGNPTRSGYDAFDLDSFQSVPQGEGGIGDRLKRLTTLSIEAGADAVLFIGTDSPTLSRRHLGDAENQLVEGHADVVIGPAFDGGYYLIGLTTRAQTPFDDIDWSTARVLRQTLQQCHRHDLVCELLEFWYDVDTLSDLQLLRDHLLEYLDRKENIAPRTTEWLKRQGTRWLDDE